jgi:LDH2 family malate/lactate/ureidoglycolate dehydrogenase
MAQMLRCAPEALERFSAEVFRSVGADADIAAEVARHLVRSNLSGHDSHGVIRIPQYIEQIDRGEYVPSARPEIVLETPVASLIDAHRGFGHYSTAFALDWAARQARRHGIAAAAVRHSMHIGRLGEYTERAGELGLIAIVTVGAGGPGVGGMLLHGGRGRFFGANPWSIGIPGLVGPPMIFDGSTSTVAEGKVRVARSKGAALPPGCIVDREGRPTTDPNDFYAGGALTPLGGEVAGHKGYGLAFASVLLGALAMIDDPDPTLIGASVVQETPDRRGILAGVFLAVIDPACFGDAGHYRAMVSEMLAAAKRMPPAPGSPEVLVPGEPEVRTRGQRSREGIGLPETTWQELARVGERFRIPLPERRSL